MSRHGGRRDALLSPRAPERPPPACAGSRRAAKPGRPSRRAGAPRAGARGRAGGAPGRSWFATARGSAETAAAGNSLTRLTKQSAHATRSLPCSGPSWQPHETAEEPRAHPGPGGGDESLPADGRARRRRAPSCSTTRLPRRYSATHSRTPASCRAAVGQQLSCPSARTGRRSRCTSCRPALRSSSAAPHHETLFYTGIDGVRREVAITAFPLMGREQELQGAFVIFWHPLIGPRAGRFPLGEGSTLGGRGTSVRQRSSEEPCAHPRTRARVEPRDADLHRRCGRDARVFQRAGRGNRGPVVCRDR